MGLIQKKIIVGQEQKIFERIRMLRLNVLVHSVIYYKLGKNIITDEEFDRRSKELCKIQKKYANVAATVKEWGVHSKAFIKSKTFKGIAQAMAEQWGGEFLGCGVGLFKRKKIK